MSIYDRLNSIVELLSEADEQEFDESFSGGALDQHAARELELYIDNDYQSYKDKVNSFYKPLTVKIAQGRYDSKLAAKLFMHLVDRAAKKYVQEHAHGSDWHEVFSKSTREAVAKELVSEFEDVVKDDPDELEKFIPKKYRGKKLTIR